jgi:tRNA nucleotidyltransferase (CCA-adding enzyme)
LLAALERAVRPSQLLEVLGDADVEAIVLAGALGELRSARKATTAVRRWLQELRGVRLAITGDDLLAAGVPSGPQVGRLLELVLGMRLDGELGDDPGRQLDAALALAETR